MLVRMLSALWIMCGVAACAVKHAPPAWPSQGEALLLAQRLKAALPAGWDVTVSGSGGIPDGWRSTDTRTVHLNAANSADAFRVWFVPLDWIGIRPADPKGTEKVYWEGVLSDSTYKAITPDGPFLPFERLESVPAFVALEKMDMHQPSLVNTHWTWATFKRRISDMDRRTQDLVRRFCSSHECEDAAARSLIVLGVPAQTLTLECAARAAGQAGEFCVSALAHWPAGKSVRVLNEVVANPATESSVRKYAAFSLQRHAHPSSGAPLLEGLKLTPPAEQDAASAIAEALGVLRYRLAGAEILARLRSEREAYYQQAYVRILADLRYEPALPAIDALCDTAQIDADWLSQQSTPIENLPEISRLRMVGRWGAARGGLRMLLLPPARDASDGRIRIAALIENIGVKEYDRLLSTAGIWIIDGKEYPMIDPIVIDGNFGFGAGALALRTADITDLLSPTSQSHTISYSLLGASSNLLTVTVR